MIARFFLTALLTMGFTPTSTTTLENHGAPSSAQVGSFLSMGEQFTFLSEDGQLALRGILFHHPRPKGLIVVVNGRSESWLKYGELFEDLYRRGFSVASYDHRGQGLSPRLIPGNPQIGWVDGFPRYTDDLTAFLHSLRERLPSPLDRSYLLAHSMGATVSVEFLAKHPGVFRAAAFTSPMFRINTAPWPEPVASLLLCTLRIAGQGKLYAPGEHNVDPSLPFASNRVTGSPDQWNRMLLVTKDYPESTVGGASVDWVAEAMEATRTARLKLPLISTPILLLLAGRDALVVNQAPPSTPRILSVTFPESRHEILMESDSIRNVALRQILNFYSANTDP